MLDRAVLLVAACGFDRIADASAVDENTLLAVRLARFGKACINVTLLDGLVFARSAFASSMHYRSVTVFGRARLVDELEEKKRALHVINEYAMPGRSAELREPLENELKMTGVIALQIESASAKISSGMPEDEDEDYEIPIWAGVLPLETRTTTLQSDDRLIDDAQASAVVRALQNKLL